MSITEEKLSLIRVDFETGMLNRAEIASKHGIATRSIYNYSRQLGWKYALKRDDARLETNKRVYERLIQERSELGLEVTSRYLEGAEIIHKLVIGTTDKLKSMQDLETELTRKEQEKLQIYLRSLKLASETLNHIFIGQRKALGMDEGKKVEQSTEIRQTGVLVVPGLADDLEQWQRETIIHQKKIISGDE